MQFQWNQIQFKEDGKILLLWRHERIFEEGLVQEKSKVLDVGGWGVLASRLLQEGHECTILDLFTKDQYYPERVKSLPYIEGSILDKDIVNTLPRYNLITCFETLEHVEDATNAILNMFSLLENQGWLVGTIPIPGICHKVDDLEVTFLTIKKIKNILKKVGFKNILVEETPSINKTDELMCSYYFKGQKVE